MKYGAYYNRRDDDMVWFRTARSLEAGFYRRHARRAEPPDVYIADSVPELIMRVYPWLHEEEASFQNQVGRPGGECRGTKPDIREDDRSACTTPPPG